MYFIVLNNCKQTPKYENGKSLFKLTNIAMNDKRSLS